MLVSRRHRAENSSQRFLVGVLLYALLFWAAYIGYAIKTGIIGNDFGVFYRAASEPLSSVYALREANPFAYPPTTLFWLKPLAWLTESRGFALWIMLSIGVIGWTSYRLAGLRVALLVVGSPALATTIAVGQFGALVGALVLLAVSLKGWRQGLLLGVAATIKAQILLAAPLILLVRRDWGALFGAGLAVVTTLLAEVFVLGPGLWLGWIKALHAFPDAVERAHAYAGSVSPAGLASHFHLSPFPFVAIGAAIAVIVIWKRAHMAEPLELSALIIIASALMSPYLMVYDIVAVMPFVIHRMLSRRDGAAMPALGFFVCPFACIALLWFTASLTLRKRPKA